jgi:hypothetical protein
MLRAATQETPTLFNANKCARAPGRHASLVVENWAQNARHLYQFVLRAKHCPDVFASGGGLITKLVRQAMVEPDSAHLSAQHGFGHLAPRRRPAQDTTCSVSARAQGIRATPSFDVKACGPH